MRKLVFSFNLFVVVTLTNMSFIKSQELVVFSPLIGDTLDRVEEEYFKLFPSIRNFKEATFYDGENDSLAAMVKYFTESSVKDTLVKNYIDKESLSMHIKNIVLANIKIEDYNLSTVSVIDGNSYEGILFNADQDYVTLLDPGAVERGIVKNKDNMMKSIHTEIIEIVSVEQSNKSSYISYGALIGTAMGLVTGLILASGRDSYNWYLLNDESGEILYVTGITLTGSLIGTIGGFIAGEIAADHDLVFEPKIPSGLSELQKYAPYQRKIQSMSLD